MPGKPQADERNTPNAIPLGGGMPIMVGNEVVGAVGVSGTEAARKATRRAPGGRRCGGGAGEETASAELRPELEIGS